MNERSRLGVTRVTKCHSRVSELLYQEQRIKK